MNSCRSPHLPPTATFCGQSPLSTPLLMLSMLPPTNCAPAVSGHASHPWHHSSSLLCTLLLEFLTLFVALPFLPGHQFQQAPSLPTRQIISLWPPVAGFQAPEGWVPPYIQFPACPCYYLYCLKWCHLFPRKVMGGIIGLSLSLCFGWGFLVFWGFFCN